jgi:Na+/H+ antiporter NhaD/arsenite permease-like protein
VIIPIVVLAIVFILIATRRIGKVKLQIWQVMFFGAFAVLVFGQITPYEALLSINADVIIFLFGMFIVGEALVESGYLPHLVSKLFGKVKSPNLILLSILLSMGVASAFLMNDTLAIIGTPVVLFIGQKCNLPPKLMLLSLAFAVTIGSVVSPIGNPQNLLVALSGGIQNPFVDFAKFLVLPTLANFFIAFILLKLFFRKEIKECFLGNLNEPIKDPKLASVSKVSLIFLVILVSTKIATVFLNIQTDFRLTYIALLPAAVIVFFSSRRLELIKKVDWRTLIFFVAMFILMESVWQSGFFQALIAYTNLNITSLTAILLAGALLSQLFSNVPLVALYLPLLLNSGVSTKEFIALAAGSTIAGNLFILGAASNIIIIQNAERKHQATFSFFDFAKIGIPLTAANLTVLWLFLAYVP